MIFYESVLLVLSFFFVGWYQSLFIFLCSLRRSLRDHGGGLDQILEPEILKHPECFDDWNGAMQIPYFFETLNLTFVAVIFQIPK